MVIQSPGTGFPAGRVYPRVAELELPRVEALATLDPAVLDPGLLAGLCEDRLGSPERPAPLRRLVVVAK